MIGEEISKADFLEERKSDVKTWSCSDWSNRVLTHLCHQSMADTQRSSLSAVTPKSMHAC